MHAVPYRGRTRASNPASRADERRWSPAGVGWTFAKRDTGHMGEAAGSDRRAEFRAIFRNEDRFREWYEVAARRLYGYLFGRCGGDAALTEDLTQQAFLQAVRKRDTYAGEADLTTWLIAIGRNVFIDHVRRVDREERQRLQLIARDGSIDERDSFEHRADQREAIVRALAELPTSQRAALVLHHFDGMSIASVAQALDRSEGAVEQLLHRGRARFRQVVAEADLG